MSRKRRRVSKKKSSFLFRKNHKLKRLNRAIRSRGGIML